MNLRRLIAMVVAALLVAGAAVWVSVRSRPERAAPGDRPVLASLAQSIDAISQVRVSRGDGTATTLQRRDGGWFVAQRNYPADPGKLRSLLIGLSGLHTIEQKTSDPARYAALNVEDAAGVQARSVRIDVVAGAQAWSLLVGKAAESNASYVRVPGAAAALLAKPRIDADPQPARWIKPELLDVAADRIAQVTVHPADGPSYWIARDARGAADLTLHGVPAGRKPAGPGVVDAIARSLARLNVEDVKERTAGAPAHPSRASFRTFEGLQLDLEGHRDGATAWIRINASVDRDGAGRFASPSAAAGQAKAPDQAKAPEQAKAPDQAKGPDQAKAPDATSEAAEINARLQAFDFQIPVYQYDTIYRQLTDLLAPPAPSATTARSKEPR
ncbi:MAG: DUF4340 domain-containing protein [Betaproteobacteria bacterium]|nr:MAG: DUF4340 domain-containing protein [Betaproteobacteria bacterium]